MLKNLSFEDLVLARAVYRATRSCIEPSLALQTKMFFKVGCERAVEEIQESRHSGTPSHTTRAFAYIPLLSLRGDAGCLTNGPNLRIEIGEHYFRAIYLSLTTHKHLSLPPSASCRLMSLAQPPTKRITIVIHGTIGRAHQCIGGGLEV